MALALRKYRAALAAFMLVVFVPCIAWPTATTIQIDGNGNRVYVLTANGDSTASSAGSTVPSKFVRSVRMVNFDGAKTFELFRGTITANEVPIWASYTTGASSSTTFTLESLPNFAYPPEGLTLRTNSTSSSVYITTSLSGS